MKMLATILILAVLTWTVNGQAPEVRIGDCSGSQFQATNSECHVNFWVDIKMDPEGDCIPKYERMVNCTRDVIKGCLESTVRGDQLAAFINMFLSLIIQAAEAQSIYCEHGGIVLSFLTQRNPDYPEYGCTEPFYQLVPACVDEYHAIFANNHADARLCRKYNETMECALDNIDRYCTEEEAQLLKLNVHVVNPICRADDIIKANMDGTTIGGRPYTPKTVISTDAATKEGALVTKTTDKTLETKITKSVIKQIKAEESAVGSGRACVRFNIALVLLICPFFYLVI